MVRVAGPNIACSTITCGAVATAVTDSDWAAIVVGAISAGDDVARAMVPGTLMSQVSRRPTARVEPHPCLRRLNGPCEVVPWAHACSVPPHPGAAAWGRPATQLLRRGGNGSQGGTRMMQSDVWLCQCACSDFIGI